MESRTQKRSRVSHGAVRSEETHRAIIEAAAAILEESGYAGFTLDAVVKRAGSSKPSIYRWWKNKAALIVEVYERSGEAGLATSRQGDLRAAVGPLPGHHRRDRARGRRLPRDGCLTVDRGIARASSR